MGDAGGYGQADPADTTSGFNRTSFYIRQALARVSTAKLVKVLAVDTDAKTVDLQPMVNQLDGIGNSTPQPQVFAIPYLYFQCGNGAIIADPVVGDKGLAVFCDRDNSSVLATKDVANPGSYRKLDVADGVYVCALPGLNDAPEQSVTFTPSGMELQDKNSNVLSFGSSGISINGLIINQSGQVAGALPVTGALELGGSIEALSGGEYAGDIATSGRLIAADVFTPTTAGGPPTISLRGHIHSANNTPPTPGH